jgi:hypothetical protein
MAVTSQQQISKVSFTDLRNGSQPIDFRDEHCIVRTEWRSDVALPNKRAGFVDQTGSRPPVIRHSHPLQEQLPSHPVQIGTLRYICRRGE